MATSNKKLQFLRNEQVFESHDAALTALEAQLKAAPDGSPVIARYNTTVEEGGQPKTKVRTLFGISGKGSNNYEIFDNQGKNDAIDTAIEDLIGDADEGFDTLKGIQDKIKAMNLTAVGGGDGDVITTVSEADGKVSASKSSLSDIALTGYAKTSATGAIAATDTLENALSKLENTVGANKISNADKSIVVTEPTEGATTTDIKVNIKSDEKVIKLGNDGIYTNLNLVKITGGTLPETVKERYEFRDSNGNIIGEAINIAKDSHISSITYDETTQKLIYKYFDASGVEQTTQVDMAHLILETEVENGIQSNNGKLSIKLDTNGDDTGNGKFLTVGTDGLKLDGVTDAITAAVEALNATESQTAGTDGLALSITEVAGKITSISGSIAANTYDAQGAASTAEQNAKDYADIKKSEVIGTAQDTAESDTIKGAKAYADSKVGDVVGSLDGSATATPADGDVYSVLTSVTQTNGVISKGGEVILAAVAKTGAAADVSFADSHFDATNVDDAIAELATFNCGTY